MAIQLRIEDRIGIIELDHPQAKVNLLTSEVMQRLNQALDEVEKNPDLQAILIVSKKKDVFIAGADIKEIEGITETAEGLKKSEAGQRILDRLEDLKIPTIAVIDGAALGGGCELALACRFRVATFNEKVRIGLPEVNLGIIPGFGGTYRLPKVVGLERGIRMIVTGKVVSGQEAFKSGLLDWLFPQKGLDEQVRRFVKDILDGKVTAGARSKKKLRQKFLEDNPLGRFVLFNESRQSVQGAAKGFYPAPLKALEAIEFGYGKPRAQALANEAKVFSELAITDVSKNLVKVFYLSEKYKKLQPPGTENLAALPIHKAGVVGAGVMGGGIAQLLSYNGMRVRMKDVNYESIGKGLKAAAKIFKDAVKKKRLTQAEASVKMNAISGTLDYSGFKSVDLIIEAVVENMDVKKKVFAELGGITSEKAILCSNTSALSVTEMAQVAKNPARVVGLHFFNPVHRMPLIEIIKTPQTSAETLATVLQLTKRLGKTPIVVKDSCGFLVNRILLAYMNEAGHLLEEGGSVGEIDRVMTRFGMPMGPFTLSDEVGLDVGIKVLHILEGSFGSRFKPVDTFEKIYQAGFLGKKSGKGFYIYQTKKSFNPKASALINVKNRRYFKAVEARDRMIYIMVNEAARCLEEGIVDETDAVDAGMIMGTGFPPFHGGLLRYADSVGLAEIVQYLQVWAAAIDERFKPCKYLADLAARNGKFYE